MSLRIALALGLICAASRAPAQTSEGPFHQQQSGHAGRDSSRVSEEGPSAGSGGADSSASKTAADSSDEGNTQDTYVPRSKRRFIASTGHGVFFGRGRQTDEGFHALDSAATGIRQFSGDSRFSEGLDADINTDLGKKKLQSAEGDITLQFKRNGFLANAGAGAEYSTVLFDRVTRKEKVKPKASFDRHFVLNGSQTFDLDADSTWEWKNGAGYDDLGGAFRTFDISSTLDKSIGDFDFYVGATGLHENEHTVTTDCAGKGKGKACADSVTDASLLGYGLSFETDWDSSPHDIDFKLGMDWQKGTQLDRILSIGLGYAYSPTKWMDIGGSVYRERDFDSTTQPRFWVAGVSLDLDL